MLDPTRLAATGVTRFVASSPGERPFLAATHGVTDAPWGVLVTVDEAEALAGFRFETRRMALVVLATLLAVAGGGLGLWRAQRSAHAAALAGSEARFASLVEDANDPILLVRGDGTIVRANRRAGLFLGRPCETLVGTHLAELVPEELHADVRRDREIAATLGGGVFESVLVNSDGIPVPVEISSRLLRLDGEEVHFEIVRDVTMRKAAEDALRESEVHERERARELQTILDAVPMPVWIAGDRECRSITANRRAYELLRRAPGSDPRVRTDGTGGCVARIDGRVVPGTELPLRRAAALGVDVRDVEVDLAFEDGTVRHLIGNATPIRGPDGEPVGAVAALADVTEQKRARRELLVLSRAIEQSQVSVMITDAKGDIEYVNPKFCRVSGYTAAEVVGRNPRILNSGETPPEVFADLWRRITSGDEWHGELVNRRKDGTTYRETAVISPVVDAAGSVTHFVAVKEDVTRREEAERALRAAQRDLLQAQKMEAVGRLAGGVAHDFNNMLSVILGYTELTLEQLGPDDPRRRPLEEVLRTSEQAAGLTRQLLSFSRKQVVEPRVLELNRVVSDAMRMLSRIVGEDVQIATRLSEETGSVRADPGQIEQTLMNLVVNARDAMPRGGRLLIATAHVVVGPDDAARRPEVPPGSWAMLSVTDTGSGIPAEFRDRIFEPFFTTKDAGHGTGLGLPTVYGIVHQAGGHVRFDSVLGEGTVFEVFLPRLDVAAEPGPAPVPVEVRPPASSVLADGTILLVEDEPALRDIAKIVLESVGYRVIPAQDAAEATRVAEAYEGAIDLLLTDVVMPGARGPELATRLRPRIEAGRVLFMSGYTEDALMRGTELLPGTRLLRKPFTPDALLRIVADVIAT